MIKKIFALVMVISIIGIGVLSAGCSKGEDSTAPATTTGAGESK